jgi:citrate lyase subunit alpha/citrate CoA-transferase
LNVAASSLLVDRYLIMRQSSLPDVIAGYGPVRLFTGVEPAPPVVTLAPTRVCPFSFGRDKLLRDIDAAFDACRIGNGATLSFHHHLRNGDQVLNQVLAVAARRGLRDLRVAASSLFPVHAPLIEHMRAGVVTRLTTAYIAGPVADAISRGALATPIVMMTHGGRARAVEAGDLPIDVAFVAAPAADRQGNLSGAEGRAACGPLGYAMVDSRHADRVVAVTDHLVQQPPLPIDIPQDQVDFIVMVDSIGDPAGILSGTTRPTTDPVGLQIASTAARVIAASGLLCEGFSLQTGAGGVSIAASTFVQTLMTERGVQGGFGAGGVTGYLVDMLEAGLFRNIYDVQCFDLKAVESYRRDRRHLAMSASLYANPHSRSPLVEQLDAMLLGAAEIDLEFNVNVTTGTGGLILGGSGGHADTAAGAKLALVATRLASSAGPKVVDRVGCLTTPGETIDAVVTEAGVAVNPKRADLHERLRSAGIQVVPIDVLRARALAAAPALPAAQPPDGAARIVGVVEYRDGRVIDVIRQVRG